MTKNEIIIRCIGTILVMFLTQFSIFSQNRAIQGVVIDDLDYEPVPYVSIDLCWVGQLDLKIQR